MDVDLDEALSLLRRFRDNETLLRCRLTLMPCAGFVFGRIIGVSETEIKFASDDSTVLLAIPLNQQPIRFAFGEPGGPHNEGTGEMLMLRFGPISPSADNIAFSEWKEE